MDRLHRLAEETCRGLPVGLHRQEDLRWELIHHLEDTAREFLAAGLSLDEAVERAAEGFGDPAAVRAQFLQSMEGGPTAMWRRVIVPALLTLGGTMLIEILCGAISFVNRYWADTIAAGRQPILPVPIPQVSDWLMIPLIFAGCYLCGVRGGTKRQCIFVGLSPLILVVPFIGWMLARLGFGSVSAGTISLGSAFVRSAYISQLLGWIGTCAAGVVLYLIAFHRIAMARRATAAEPEPAERSP